MTSPASFFLGLRTYLAPSTVCDGVGVFSLKLIKQDSLIFQPSSNIRRLPWNAIDEDIHEHVRSLTNNDLYGFWIDDSLDRLGHQYYINHSQTPNVSYNHSNSCLYAMVDIEPGTELLTYYHMEERDWLT